MYFQEIGKLSFEIIYEIGHNKEMYVEGKKKKTQKNKHIEMEYKQLSKEERCLHGELI